MQVCKYASMQVSNMQVCKYASIQICHHVFSAPLAPLSMPLLHTAGKERGDQRTKELVDFVRYLVFLNIIPKYSKPTPKLSSQIPKIPENTGVDSNYILENPANDRGD